MSAPFALGFAAAGSRSTACLVAATVARPGPAAGAGGAGVLRQRPLAGAVGRGVRRAPPVLVLVVAAVGLANSETIWEVGRPQGHVDILEEVPTPRDFHRKFMNDEDGPFGKAGRPALFKGAAKVMPAFELWTDDYLRKKHGKSKMDQVETEKTETRSKLPHEDWTLADFLDRYNTSDVYSTATTPKSLSNEVYLLPPMNCGGFTRRLSSTVTWFSSGDTKSVIHKDGQHNFHCIIDGKKDWILWHPKSPIESREFGWINGEEEAARDAKFKDTYGVYAGLIDPDNVNLKRFPKWDKLKWWSMHMEAGDCAYIPPSWFHFVQSPKQRSISVHIWFFAGKFDQKSCDALDAKGYSQSDYLVRIGDCSWGFEHDNQKKTSCNIRKPLRRNHDEL